MENEVSMWIYRALIIMVILIQTYFIAMYMRRIYLKKRLATKKSPDKIKEDVTRINTMLLDMGMSYRNIEDFWQECFVEAEIRHNLPPCTCKDVNQCETWCRAKARFTLNPPLKQRTYE